MSLYTELWARIGDIATDVGSLYKIINKAVIATTADNTSVYRTDRDANGIFVTVTYKRRDGTNAKTSVLSIPDGNNRYTRRTETYFDTNGTTVLDTRVYTLSYNGFGELTSEVLT